MTFAESISTCFSKYADFNGRASRSEYWWFQLFFTLIYVGSLMISEVLVGLVSLGFIIPLLAVGSRRLHDTNHSGWLQLLNIIPIANFYVIYLLIKKSGIEGEPS